MVYYRPSGRARERIMAYGGIGAGKSRGLLDILKRTLGPTDTGYIIDADNSWDRLLDSEYAAPLTVREEWRGDVLDSTNLDPDGKLVVYHTRGWEQHMSAMKEIWSQANRDDWIGVDDSTWYWNDIQRWYYELVHGQELPDFLLQHRIQQVKDGKITAKDKADAGQEAQLLDWNFINPQWFTNVAEPFVNPPCHLYVCANAKAIRTDGRVDKNVTDLFGGVGYSPATQKLLGGQMQTVLFLERTRAHKYKMSSVKDRERDLMDGVEWDNLFSDYLRKIAGWKVAK